ncbi:MAG: hypothetical protein KTR25_20070 [Myxococcales bacterium]|nr:hypothetical protein [Myxococcales bacterium]
MDHPVTVAGGRQQVDCDSHGTYAHSVISSSEMTRRASGVPHLITARHSRTPFSSSSVSSPQTEPDPRVSELVTKHLQCPWRRPIATHTLRAWECVQAVLSEEAQCPIVLDSGCGTGESARKLAECHPECWIVAADQSAYRLRLKASIRRSGRIVWVRAELGDLWRLMLHAKIQLKAHYLLYPNPWPKKQHLRRRWHGHPAFPTLLRLGGYFEARSNWSVYLQELAIAIHAATGTNTNLTVFRPTHRALSPFELKYAASGHELYRLRCRLPKQQDS